MSDATRAAGQAGRRFLIAIGTRHYENLDELPGVPHDVDRVVELFTNMGYTRVLGELSVDSQSHTVRSGLDRWARDIALEPDDVVVLYYAGHGISAADRHYLAFTETDTDLLDSTSLPSEDFGRALARRDQGHLLMILDTCYAGAGAEDIAVMTADLTSRPAGGRWSIAAARGKDKAKENAFVDALVHVTRDRPNAGARQPYLGVGDVTKRINTYFEQKGLTQRAENSVLHSDGREPFIPNPAYIPDLPADDLDLDALTRLREKSRGHFDIRGRGLEHAGERGDFFTGRTLALTHLADWLGAEQHDARARVITGDPGSGKSALLGHLLMLCDPDHPARRTTTAQALPPQGTAPLVLHARRCTLEDLVADIAAALGCHRGATLDEVLSALGRRSHQVTILVDALDEAGTAGDAREADRIAQGLLQPMTTMVCVRLIVGTRRTAIQAVGRAVTVLDLDLPAWTGQDDIAQYTRALLLNPDSPSPYKGQPELATRVSAGIAARADRSFLVARMTSRALIHGQITVDTSKDGWQQLLPSDAGQAFAGYLARFGHDEDRVRRLLTPLAYAQGAGLPWSYLWAPLAQALSGRSCPEEDIAWLQRHAGSYIVETGSSDGSVYRLFHEALAEYLRTPGRDADAHRAIAETLTKLVPHDSRTLRPQWDRAHSYTRDHLATHASHARTLDPLLEDSEYLIHATAATLLRALDSCTTDSGRLTAAIYRTSADRHRDSTTDARRDILAIDAARYQQPVQAAALARERRWVRLF